MNTAIADAFDLSWKLAFVERGIADPALLATYEAERGPIGRGNVAMSMVPGGGGSNYGLAEDLELAPRRVRSALLPFLRRLRAAGLRVEAAEQLLDEAQRASQAAPAVPTAHAAE